MFLCILSLGRHHLWRWKHAFVNRDATGCTSELTHEQQHTLVMSALVAGVPESGAAIQAAALLYLKCVL